MATHETLTTLPCSKAAGDRVRATAKQNGFLLIRFVEGLSRAWDLLTPEQRLAAMQLDAAADPASTDSPAKSA